jgi:hypothetical protein
MINGQISMFELLGMPETPEIPLEEQKKGRRGWIIEISAICTRENGYKEDKTYVCTRPVIFEADTREKNNRWWQTVRTTHGPYHGWSARPHKVYAKRPTWEECLRYAEQDRNTIGKIEYMERDGDWNFIYGYENGYRKGA